MGEKNKEQKYKEEVQRRIILSKISATVGCKSKKIKKASLKKRIEKCCRGTKQMKMNGQQTWVRGKNKNEDIRNKVADTLSYNIN